MYEVLRELAFREPVQKSGSRHGRDQTCAQKARISGQCPYPDEAEISPKKTNSRFDPRCVKTQKFEKGRERTLLPPPRFTSVANFSGPRAIWKNIVLSPLRKAEFLHGLDPKRTAVVRRKSRVLSLSAAANTKTVATSSRGIAGSLAPAHDTWTVRKLRSSIGRPSILRRTR
jgi:hypothetical protein